MVNAVKDPTPRAGVAPLCILVKSKIIRQSIGISIALQIFKLNKDKFTKDQSTTVKYFIIKNVNKFIVQKQSFIYRVYNKISIDIEERTRGRQNKQLLSVLLVPFFRWRVNFNKFLKQCFAKICSKNEFKLFSLAVVLKSKSTVKLR